jgi:hypothetical protein
MKTLFPRICCGHQPVDGWLFRRDQPQVAVVTFDGLGLVLGKKILCQIAHRINRMRDSCGGVAGPINKGVVQPTRSSVTKKWEIRWHPLQQLLPRS